MAMRPYNPTYQRRSSAETQATWEREPRRPRGVYLRVSTGWGLDNLTPQVESNWKLLRRG